jgi:hypothetical protein
MFMLFNATFNNISIISCGRDARTISINVKYIFLVYQLELTRTGNFKPSFVKIRPVVAKLWPFQLPDPPPPSVFQDGHQGKHPFQHFSMVNISMIVFFCCIIFCFLGEQTYVYKNFFLSRLVEKTTKGMFMSLFHITPT